MSTRQRIKVAVIGAGIMGKIHAQSYLESEKTELIYVCDLMKERAKVLAKECNCSHTSKTEEIANNPEIRAVSITTPDFAHREIALEMIEAGKDILVEKPLATSVKDAQDIVDAARKKEVKLMVNFQNRWSPLFVQAKQTIAQGDIGKPIMGYARLSNPLSVPLEMLSWASKSGPEWFLLPHTIDLMRWLINKEPKEVYATGTKGILEGKGIDVYDAIQALVKFEGGSFVTFETSWILPNSWPALTDFQLMLLGSKGRIGIEGDQQGVDIATDKFSWPFVLGLQHAYGKSFGFSKEPLTYFMNCLYEDKEPMCSGEDGLIVTKVVEAILKSIKERKRILV